MSTNNSRPFPIIGIGASAGGLSSFESLLRTIPADLYAAIVFLQHLSPDHKSLLPDLLQSQRPDIIIREVDTPMEIIPGVLYLKSAENDLIIEKKRLVPIELYKQSPRLSIDRFFFSLAKEYKKQAVAVILSGAGYDGMRGAREVRLSGGIVIAQSPETAEFDSMPQAVINNGDVDKVLEPGQIIPAISRYFTFTDYTSGHTLEESTINVLFKLVHETTGHDFLNYKQGVINRRVMRRIGLLGLTDIDEYLSVVRSNPDELYALDKDMMISVTTFFRDPEAWEVLRKEVIGSLARKIKVDPLRVWTPACATGEEPYSVAMMIQSEMDAANTSRDYDIFATDIDSGALKLARAGRYPESASTDIPQKYIGTYITCTEEPCLLVVNKELREHVIFAPHNLLTDPPFSNLDLIICRNLLIYLKAEAQSQCLKAFHYALKPQGFLFLGTAESTEVGGNLFSQVGPKDARIYRKVTDTEPTGVQSLHFHPASSKREYRDSSRAANQKNSTAEVIQNALLKLFAPAAVGVDNQLEILYRSGPTHRYLVHPSGPETASLPAHLPSTFRVRLQTAAQKVQHDKVPVSLRATFVINGKRKPVSVTISPLEGELMLVAFKEMRKNEQMPQKESLNGHYQIQQLEHELTIIRENHEKNLYELKNLNEELQTSNEELHAANEELETSREELQSLNEELITVNNQLLEKNSELEATNNDLNNFLTSTAIPTLFLDEQLRIRRFTPAVTKLIKLLPADIGRALTNFAYESLGSGLLDEARVVLREGVSLREEISFNSSWYIRTLRPYTIGNNRVQGVVVTFADISDIKNAESNLRESEEKFRIVADFTYDWEYWRGKDNRFLYVTPSCERVTGYSREEFMKDPSLYGRIIHPEDREWFLKHLSEDQTSTGNFELEFRIIHRDGNIRWISHACQPVLVESDNPLINGRIQGRRASNRDITDRKQTEEILRENENKFSIAFQSSPGFMFISDLRTGKFIDVNQAFCRMSGWSKEELLGHSSTEMGILSSEERQNFFAKLYKESHILNEDAKIHSRNGKIRDILYSAEVIRLGEKQYILSTGIDITERNLTQKALQIAADRFNRITSSNIVGIIIADFAGDIVFANKYFLHVIGYNQQDLEQHKIRWNEITPGEYLPLDYDALRQLNKKGIASPYEKQFLRKDGSRVWVYLSDVMLPGPENQIIAFVLDITERKRAEEALRRSEASLKRSQAIAHLGSWELNLVTNYLTWSDEVYRIFGLKPQEFGATYEEFLSRIHPEDRDAVDSAYTESVRDGRDFYEIEHRVVRKYTGEIRYVHEKCHHVRDEQGKIVRSVGMVHDITNRKQAELQLKKYTEELSVVNRDLESFSYSVSHDLRSPLNTISGFAGILNEDYAAILDDEGRDYVRRIIDSISKMQMLIDDMLSLSRVGRQEMLREDVDLSTIVHHLLSELQSSEPERKVNFVVQDNVHASADPRLIRLAIDNLLRNAWKFTSTKEIARIEFGTTSIENRPVYFISDNGEGFDMKHAEKIFEPFKRGHTERLFGGTGVGLSIVQRVIRRHGGKVWAEAKPKEGASFFFTLA